MDERGQSSSFPVSFFSFSIFFPHFDSCFIDITKMNKLLFISKSQRSFFQDAVSKVHSYVAKVHSYAAQVHSYTAGMNTSCCQLWIIRYGQRWKLILWLAADFYWNFLLGKNLSRFHGSINYWNSKDCCEINVSCFLIGIFHCKWLVHSWLRWNFTGETPLYTIETPVSGMKDVKHLE